MSFVTDDETTDESDKRSQRPRSLRKDPLGPDGEIGSRLRALYLQVESEPIPIQLIELLEQLSEAERKAGR